MSQQNYSQVYCVTLKHYDVMGYSPSNWNTSGFNYFLNTNKLVEPLPYYDLSNDLGKFFMTGEYLKNRSWLFAFETKEKFNNWFDTEFINSIKNSHDLYLVSIPTDKLIIGEKQCVFWTSDVKSRFRLSL